jgi:peptidoglycan hydrolase-like protein with peptidoglycan-binding domain
MTAATLTHLPFAAGSAVLASAGRAALWALSRYMRAPLTHTAILSMVSLTAMAGSNALYFQAHKHPAPLFSPVVQQAAVAPQVRPVVPAVRQKRPVLAPLPKAETTGSIAPESTPIGNAEVFELQRKLEMLKLFEGTIDGYYGPQTARAIKKFEELNGMKPKGELTTEILELVRSAPAIAATPVVEALPAPDPLPATDALPKVEMQPVAKPGSDPEPLAAVMPRTTTTVVPLPAPAPLPIEVQSAPAAKKQPAAVKTPMGRELPESPQEAFNLAVETAGDAIDTIIDGVQTVTMTKPPVKQPVAVQPFAPDPVAEIVATAAAPAAEPAAETATQVAMAAPAAVPGKPLVVAEPEPEAVAEVPVLDTEAKPEDLMPAFSVTDPVIVSRVQRGLASLGFLHGPADGVAGEATAKAIRNFEVYYNYKVTGRISPELLDLLVQNGASI